jgi:hypothetical protein
MTEQVKPSSVATSTGGPVTEVTWSKDNVNIRSSTASNEVLYEHSQIITNTTRVLHIMRTS